MAPNTRLAKPLGKPWETKPGPAWLGRAAGSPQGRPFPGGSERAQQSASPGPAQPSRSSEASASGKKWNRRRSCSRARWASILASQETGGSDVKPTGTSGSGFRAEGSL